VAQESRDTESLLEAGSRIEALSLGIDRADELLRQGDAEAARQRYLSALDQIPAAREGYDQLSILEARRRSRTQAEADRQVAATLAQGRSLFEGEEYEQSLERYREALTLLLDDSAAAGRIVDQIGEISARLTAASAAVAAEAPGGAEASEPSAGTEPTARPDPELLARLEQAQDRIAELERENSLLTDRLESLQQQQQLLQGDQAEVAAQLAQLEEDKASLTAAVEQLRSEKAGLTTQLARLETRNQDLSAERDALLSQRDTLQAERDRLAAAQVRAREAEAAREELRERLSALESRYQAQRRSAAQTSETDPETLAELLEAKLLTWQIIGSDPVASQYPALYDTMDRYLETLTEQSLLQGRFAAVGDIITVVDALLGSPQAAEVPTELWRRYSYSDQQDLLGRLLDKLETVVE
jgi:hypothetical protein